MKAASMALVSPEIAEIELVYDKFDIGLDGRPTPFWESRNLKKWKPPEMMQHAFFPDVYLARVLVNHRMLVPLGRVYAEIVMRWTRESRDGHGLNQFVKCYAFGDGEKPNLFWYGAAWRLSQQVGGEVLSEVIKVFTRHGFTYCGTNDKRRLRDFEFW
jgi:hypothetical protein